VKVTGEIGVNSFFDRRLLKNELTPISTNFHDFQKRREAVDET